MELGPEEAFWFGMWMSYNKGISPREYKQNLTTDLNMVSFIDNQVGTRKIRMKKITEAMAQMRGL